MKRLIEFFARQHLFGNLLSISIIFVGVYAVFAIRREVFPNVSFDVIGVTTTFPGASATEVEKLITNPLEQDLKEVDGIKKMTSHTVDGRSLILLQLNVGSTTEEKAKSDVRDVVDQYIPDLPEGADRPLISTFDTKHTPLVEVAVSAEMSDLELRQAARRLELELETVRGVASVKPMGLRDLEMQVEVSPAALQKFHIGLSELVDALKRQNISVPGGTIEGTAENKFVEFSVRTSGQFQTPEDVLSTVIRANDVASPVRVRDIAKITYGLEKPPIQTRVNGHPCVRLTILKDERADAIDLVDSVTAKINELKPSLDSRVTLTLVNDASEYIRRRLGILLGNFWIGLAMVLFLLPMFLPVRFAMVVAAGEPFAFLGAILAFYGADTSLNMVSLIGLILVSGILVDDGIVVSENVARLIKSGLSPKEAAIRGSQEVWVPVVASAAVTCMAFVPLAMMTGIFGKFIKYIPLGIIVPIGISLFENFFIMPHHMASWLRRSDFEKPTGKKGWLARIQGVTNAAWDDGLMPRYERILKAFLRHRYWVLFGCFVAVVGAGLFATKVMKFVLFPPEGVEIFMVRIEAPRGTSLEGTTEKLVAIERQIAALPTRELKNYLTVAGVHQQDGNDPNTRRGTEYGQITVYLTPENERTRTAAQIIEDMRQKIGKPEGLNEVRFERVNPGPPVGKPISIGIRSDTYEAIIPAVKDVKAILADKPGVSDLGDSHVIGKDQLNININAREAAAAGLSVGMIGATARAAYEGLIATTIRKLDEEVKVRVFLSREYRTEAKTLQDLKIANPNGFLIPLRSVASVSLGQEIAHYQHENNRREVRVTGEVDTAKISARQANDIVRAKLEELKKKHPLTTYHFGGEDEDTVESMTSLAKAFAVAVIGIFLILVVTFRTLLQPLVLVMTIPLGMLGVVVTFFFHGMPLSFLAMVGMIGLSGIIVNNAIVYVDFVNQARKEGSDRWSSLTDAAVQRARPIFLTTVTTIISVIPTAYGIGGLDKFVVPIAMSMGWGLLAGSILALFLLPAVLAILDDLSLISHRWFGSAGTLAVDREEH